MSVDVILSRLEKVRKTGSQSWTARCPAHKDKSPSLSVRELSDGMVLVHCHALCGIEKIVSTLGIEMDELFPEKPSTWQSPQRRGFPAADVLECITSEMTVVVVAARQVADGQPLADGDRKRLLTAIERIEEARRLALGER